MKTASTNIFERIGPSQELSKFQRGTVIGWHLCNKSSYEVSSLSVTTATQSPKSTEQGQKMQMGFVFRGRQLSAESVATNFMWPSAELKMSVWRAS